MYQTGKTEVVLKMCCLRINGRWNINIRRLVNINGQIIQRVFLREGDGLMLNIDCVFESILKSLTIEGKKK